MVNHGRRGPMSLGIVLAGVVVVALFGCATKGDLRALEERVVDAQRASANRPDPFERIAALSTEVDDLRVQVRELQGQLEVAQKTARDAAVDARRARQGQVGDAATGAAAGAVTVAAAGAGATATLDAAEIPPDKEDPAASAEVLAYQEALTAWRGKDHDLCIDRFRKFLQDFPSSPYADDGAYWMADCHFKKGDYRVAVLRFNDVVRVYPEGNKAPDALYRQGESLLKLGPGFYDAAKSVFQQVLNDYPDSARAREARQQLQAIGTG